jgi:hypothetical protein
MHGVLKTAMRRTCLRRPARARLERVRSLPGGSSASRSEGNQLIPGNLSRARLHDANFFEAVLDGANLAEAFLTGAQFLNCAQLIVTRNWQSALRDETLGCGASIPNKNPQNRLAGGRRYGEAVLTAEA